jgi:hypothetical protein
VREFPEGVLPSLCLLGAGLAVANMLFMQRPTFLSRGTEVAAVAAAGNDVPSTKTKVVSTANAEPAIRAKPSVPPKRVDVAGSVKPTKKTEQKRSAQAESKLRARVAAVGKDTPSAKTKVVSTAKAEAANAPIPAGEDVTGSVKQTKKTDQEQFAQAEPALHDPNLAGPTGPGPYARPYRPRRYGWRWYYGYRLPPVGFAIRVYPRW